MKELGILESLIEFTVNVVAFVSNFYPFCQSLIVSDYDYFCCEKFWSHVYTQHNWVLWQSG